MEDETPVSEDVEVQPDAPETEETQDAEPALSVKELQRQNELYRQELELNRRKLEHFDREIAQLKQAPKPAPVAEEPDLDIDITAMAVDNDKAAFKRAVRAALKSEGYVSKAEVDALLAEKVSEYEANQQVMSEYPDLANSNSALYKATDAELSKINANPRYAKLDTPERIAIAAAKAEAKLIRDGKSSATRETQRQAAIKAQQGDPGRSSAGTETLTPAQKAAAARYGLTEAQYIAGAKNLRFKEAK